MQHCGRKALLEQPKTLQLEFYPQINLNMIYEVLL